MYKFSAIILNQALLDNYNFIYSKTPLTCFWEQTNLIFSSENGPFPFPLLQQYDLQRPPVFSHDCASATGDGLIGGHLAWPVRSSCFVILELELGKYINCFSNRKKKMGDVSLRFKPPHSLPCEGRKPE